MNFKNFYVIIILLVVFASPIFSFADNMYLSWNQPKDGGIVLGYNIYYGSIDDISTMEVIEGVVTSTYIVENLLPDTTYYFYIRAYNNFGEGPISDVKVKKINLKIVQ